MFKKFATDKLSRFRKLNRILRINISYKNVTTMIKIIFLQLNGKYVTFLIFYLKIGFYAKRIFPFINWIWNIAKNQWISFSNLLVLYQQTEKNIIKLHFYYLYIMWFNHILWAYNIFFVLILTTLKATGGLRKIFVWMKAHVKLIFNIEMIHKKYFCALWKK